MKAIKIIECFLLAIIGVGLIVLINVKPTGQGNLGSFSTGTVFSSTTITSISTSTATGVALVASSGRQYAFFQNDDATNSIYLCLAATCAASTGIKLVPGGSYSIDLTRGYTGIVSAIASASTPKLMITYNQ
jgi:hypothetical protein